MNVDKYRVLIVHRTEKIVPTPEEETQQAGEEASEAQPQDTESEEDQEVEERHIYIASIPELEEARAEGETREEALKNLEAKLTDILAGMEHPPLPVEEIEAPDAIRLKLSSAKYRDLVWLARAEHMEPEELASELLVEAITRRMSSRRYGVRRGNRNSGPRGNSRGRNRSEYFAIMEDKAAFLDYVRRLENDSKPRRR